MKRSHALLIFVVGVGLFLPALRYTFVQDDRAVILLNPSVRSIPAAIAAWNDPYWPRPSRAGLYRPLTTLSFAVDRAIVGERAWWFHLVNAIWHGVASVLIALILARWLPALGAVAAGLVFAAHPVHVEGVASLVARSEMMVAVGILAAVACARRRWWAGAVVAAVVAMFSKEHGIVVSLVVLADDWLENGKLRYPWPLYAAFAGVSAVFLWLWSIAGRDGIANIAAAFFGVGTGERLAMALPAILRGATLLVWPIDLSADYGPQVLPVRSGPSLAAFGGLLVVVGVLWLVVWARRRHPMVAFAAVIAILTYLPTANLFFPSGVVLAERNLYVPVVLVAALVGVLAVRIAAWRGIQRAGVAVGLLVLSLALRTELRLPSWSSNRRFLLTILNDHPESYRAHVWAAAVLSGVGDSAGARREYLRAEELFDRDPNLDAAHSYYLMTLGDTAAARPRIDRARRSIPDDPFALRAQFLWLMARRDTAGARALADTATSWSDLDRVFYRQNLP